MLATCAEHGDFLWQAGSEGGMYCVQSLMKLANKKGNEVGPEVVDEIESESINVVSNTRLKVQPSDSAAAEKPSMMSF